MTCHHITSNGGTAQIARRGTSQRAAAREYRGRRSASSNRRREAATRRRGQTTAACPCAARAKRASAAGAAAHAVSTHGSAQLPTRLRVVPRDLQLRRPVHPRGNVHADLRRRHVPARRSDSHTSHGRPTQGIHLTYPSKPHCCADSTRCCAHTAHACVC